VPRDTEIRERWEWRKGRGNEREKKSKREGSKRDCL